MRFKTKTLFPFVIVALSLLFPVIVHAQVDPPPDPIDTPIDGGLSVLLAAGVGYGVKKIRDSRKRSAKVQADSVEK